MYQPWARQALRSHRAFRRMLAAALVAAAVVGVAQCGLEVVTEGGRIRGISETSMSGRTFNSFYSIPYARAPIGSYRFKDPVKPGTWQRLADGSRMPSPCLQVPFFISLQGIRLKPDELVGSENCLFLNVFTPVTSPNPEKTKLPVMVWLHGGAFYAGRAEEYLPHTLLDHDVVLVVVQYRLGVLGFLSTEDSVLPGNLGLKDQTMALEWVQRNIHLFGGDKTRVTIFGESAGAASVHYQMLTPKSKGLFSRAIMQSGTAINYWASNNKPRKAAETLGHNMGCEDLHNSTALLACLQKVDAKQLASAVQDFYHWFLMPITFAPRVDGDYLPDLPVRLMVDKQYHEVDLLAGITKDEGAMVSLTIFERGLVKTLEENFAVNGPFSLGIENEKDSLSLTKSLYEHYLGDISIDETRGEQLTKLLSDMLFNVFQDEVTAQHAMHFPGRLRYRYQFDYRGHASFSNAYSIEMGKHWVGHADDLIYLFAGGTLLGPVFPDGLTNPDDIRMRETMVKLWVNFATSGNPTPDASLGFTWEPSTADNLQYLSLTTSPSMQPDNRKETREFFSSLPLSVMRVLYPEKGEQQQHDHHHHHHHHQQQQQQQQGTPREEL